MEYHGRWLVIFNKTIGHSILDVDKKYASHYIQMAMHILVWEPNSPIKEMTLPVYSHVVLLFDRLCPHTGGTPY